MLDEKRIRKMARFKGPSLHVFDTEPEEDPIRYYQKLGYRIHPYDREIPEKVLLLVEILKKNGYVAPPQDCAEAWENFSAECGAQWLNVESTSEGDIMAAMLEHLTEV